MRGRGVDREGSEEVLQACGNRAGYRPLEIRPPDDAELPQGHPWGCHQYDDGCRSVQHEALDEQKCLVFFCLLAADAGQTLNRQISLKSIFSLTTISRIPICRLSTATQS